MNFLTSNSAELHIMLDLETLSTTVPNARVTEIGAFVINYSDNILAIGTQFHRHIIDDKGYSHIDADTMMWRFRRGLYPKSKQEGAVHAELALEEFFDWINTIRSGGGITLNVKEIILWCKGTDFDVPIFKNLVTRTLGATFPLPWKYNNVRDMRTLMKVFPQFEIRRDTIEHTALADCINQSKCLVKIADYIEEMHYQYNSRVSKP